MNSGPDRPLALNIRATRIGYVLFDGPDRLADWGTLAIRREEGGVERGRTRIASLIALTSPSTVVICRARRKRDVDSRNGIRIATLIRREVALRSIPVALVTARDLQQVFGALRATNKYEMAAIAAHAYPEILWKLPPSRRRWQPEPRGMLVFDALTAGLAYWQQRGYQMPVPIEEKVLPP